MSDYFDLNNKYKYTKSLKYANVTKIKNEIVDMIDNNQEIKRLMAYPSQTPLSKIGITYENKRVDQPDLTETLTKDGTSNHECLIAYPFYEKMINETFSLMFVYCKRSRLDSDVLGSNIFEVDVVVEYGQNKLKTPLRGERGSEIISRVINLFDGFTLPTDRAKELDVGNIQFYINGNVEISRLSKTNDYIVYSMAIEARDSNARVYDV